MPEVVAVMCQLLERGWSQRRIARELGISRHMVCRYLALGTWQPYDSSNRAAQLDGCKAWLRQELLKQKGIEVSLRTVERSVQDWRESLRQSRQATVPTRPGQASNCRATLVSCGSRSAGLGPKCTSVC